MVIIKAIKCNTGMKIACCAVLEGKQQTVQALNIRKGGVCVFVSSMNINMAKSASFAPRAEFGGKHSPL